MRRWTGLVLAGVLLAACSGDDGPSSDSVAVESTSAPSTTIPPMTEALTCDVLDERACLLPWPNDAFTVPDPSTATGRRLDIQEGTTPANVDGVHIDVTDQNRADGFSPGSAILTFVPDLDVEASGIAPSTDIGSSLDPDAPIVLLDTTTGERLPYWAELDAQAPEGDQLLMIHPAAALPEGHHIVVALRDLVDTDGDPIERTSAFDAVLEGTPEPPERMDPMTDTLAALDDDGIPSDSLYVAWDFTVASSESLAGRALSMRDQAYEAVGDTAPVFTVTAQTDDGNVRTIDGTYAVPNFLTGDGSPGSTLLLGDDGLPVRSTTQPDYTAPFHCVIPLTPGNAPVIVYGHGLLGNRGEVDGLRFAADLGAAGACATDEIGMASDDLGNLATILGDLSKFPQQADRMVQGLLDQQFLGRAINSPQGFVTSPAFQAADGTPLIAPGATQFVGNSQGGILGGAASALSNEWDRAVLGVPGIDYSLLLPRSSDWPEFQSIFDVAYTDPVDRVLALQLIQLLWDRGENSGYAQHLTADPFPGTEAKQVLLVQAFGDHQVANESTDVLSRTIGATSRQPALAPGRSKDVVVQWGIEPADLADPTNAVVVLWDFGTPAPPTVNLPPTEPEYGQDPHGAGSREPLVLQQALLFLLTGQITEVCGTGPCTSDVLS